MLRLQPAVDQVAARQVGHLAGRDDHALAQPERIVLEGADRRAIAFDRQDAVIERILLAAPQRRIERRDIGGLRDPVVGRRRYGRRCRFGQRRGDRVGGGTGRLGAVRGQGRRVGRHPAGGHRARGDAAVAVQPVGRAQDGGIDEIIRLQVQPRYADHFGHQLVEPGRGGTALVGAVGQIDVRILLALDEDIACRRRRHAQRGQDDPVLAFGEIPDHRAIVGRRALPACRALVLVVVEGIDPVPQHEHVAPRGPAQAVHLAQIGLRLPPARHIFAADDHVVARTAVDRIVAAAADDRVVAGKAEQKVVAAQAQ